MAGRSWRERPVLGRARAALRQKYFDTFRRTCLADDGRDILASALGEGWLAPPPFPQALLGSSPYAFLGQAGPPTPEPAPIFITARFRTGSTLLWNIFRHVDACTAYYEPLNERRWFDPAVRGVWVDRTHAGVEEYWREYEGLSELGAYYREAWTR